MFRPCLRAIIRRDKYIEYTPESRVWCAQKIITFHITQYSPVTSSSGSQYFRVASPFKFQNSPPCLSLITRTHVVCINPLMCQSKLLAHYSCSFNIITTCVLKSG